MGNSLPAVRGINRKHIVVGKRKENSISVWISKDVEDMRLIVGLGNPGREYENTRHNVGFAFIDKLAFDFGIKVDERKHKGFLGKGMLAGEKVIVLKPQTYMNLSGESVRAAMDYYKLTPSDIIIVFDDISLEPGNIRIRTKGSAGGHNGIKSIIAHLGTQEFSRVKIGVGNKPEKTDLANHVLGKIKGNEQANIESALEDTKSAVVQMVAGETERAMNLFNKKKVAEE